MQTDVGSDDELDIPPWWRPYRKDQELHTLVLTADRAASVSAYVHGPHQCSADTVENTWQKQALYHMPGPGD